MKELIYEVVLIGDTGAPHITRPDPVLEMLKRHLPDPEKGAVVFLGDLIYPRGLPPEGHELRMISESRLLAQLRAIEAFRGRLIFISGNHDWNKGKTGGYEYVLRQEKYIETYLDCKDIYLPSKGCPGPEEIVVNDHLCIVVINTQWWVQKWNRPAGAQYGCKVSTEEGFINELRAALERNKDKRILVIGHLPVHSDSVHGGKFKWKHHIFPLTLYSKRRRAYLPMPIVGSMFTLYRKFLGAEEDISHPRYKRLRDRLLDIFKEYPGLMYAAGHDHNLQYIVKDYNHFIVSGSGSKVSYVKPGRYSRYAHAHAGFFKMKLYSNRSIELEVWETSGKYEAGKMTFQERIG